MASDENRMLVAVNFIGPKMVDWSWKCKYGRV